MICGRLWPQGLGSMSKGEPPLLGGPCGQQRPTHAHQWDCSGTQHLELPSPCPSSSEPSRDKEDMSAVPGV